MSAFADEPDHSYDGSAAARRRRHSLRADCMATTSPNWRRGHSNGRGSHASVSGSYRLPAPTASTNFGLRRERASRHGRSCWPPARAARRRRASGGGRRACGLRCRPMAVRLRESGRGRARHRLGAHGPRRLLALEAAGHRGSVFVVSRRGRFPETHTGGVLPLERVRRCSKRPMRARFCAASGAESATRERAGSTGGRWSTRFARSAKRSGNTWRPGNGVGSTGTFAAIGNATGIARLCKPTLSGWIGSRPVDRLCRASRRRGRRLRDDSCPPRDGGRAPQLDRQLHGAQPPPGLRRSAAGPNARRRPRDARAARPGHPGGCRAGRCRDGAADRVPALWARRPARARVALRSDGRSRSCG